VISVRMAISRSGGLQLDLSKMQDIVQMLRYDPTVPANQLRPFLEKYIPRFQHANSKFVCNFRDKVNKFNALSGRSVLTIEDAHALAYANAALEDIGGDSSLDPTYVREIMHRTMLGNGGIWETIAFFETIQEENPEFKYAIKKNNEGQPEAVINASMRLPMRRNSISQSSITGGIKNVFLKKDSLLTIRFSRHQ